MSDQGNYETANWRQYLPYYREKYLALIAFITGLLALLALWPWPIPADRLWRGLVCLGIAGVCVLLSRRRLFILAGALAITTLRGMIAFFWSRNWVALVIAAAAGALVWVIVRFWGHRFEDWKLPEKYTWKEMLVDVAAFNVIVAVLYFVGK